MEIIVLTLLTPLLGIGLLLCDSYRQTGLPLQSRSFWTIALRVLGCLSVLIGVVLILSGVVFLLNIPDGTWSFLCGFPLLAGLGLIAILTGLKTFRVPQSWPGVDEDWDAGEVIDRCSPLSLMSDPNAAHLRSGAWVMTFYPLLFIVPIDGGNSEVWGIGFTACDACVGLVSTWKYTSAISIARPSVVVA